MCQTAFFNSIDDFCLWSSPTPGGSVGDVSVPHFHLYKNYNTVAHTPPVQMEEEMVAWCTKAGRGTRVIPNGAITGVQFLRTPDYIQSSSRVKLARNFFADYILQSRDLLTRRSLTLSPMTSVAKWCEHFPFPPLRLAIVTDTSIIRTRTDRINAETRWAVDH
jgi:hypothetical protein